jgi:hypothetical protein
MIDRYLYSQNSVLLSPYYFSFHLSSCFLDIVRLILFESSLARNGALAGPQAPTIQFSHVRSLFSPSSLPLPSASAQDDFEHIEDCSALTTTCLTPLPDLALPFRSWDIDDQRSVDAVDAVGANGGQQMHHQMRARWYQMIEMRH